MLNFIVLCLLAVTFGEELNLDYLPAEPSGSKPDFPDATGLTRNAIDSSSSYTADTAELDKEFYSFSAPEDEFNDAAATQQALGSVKQGLRVVFIKAPENQGYQNALLALAKQAANQQTSIYVLNKQTDIGDLANKLNNINKNNNNRPEVHFVKYRTAEDAANAQRAIQSQYDTLAGRSQTINGGIAPVINFASRSSTAHRSSSIPQLSTNAYLPSSILRRYRY